MPMTRRGPYEALKQKAFSSFLNNLRRIKGRRRALSSQVPSLAQTERKTQDPGRDSMRQRGDRLWEGDSTVHENGRKA